MKKEKRKDAVYSVATKDRQDFQEDIARVQKALNLKSRRAAKALFVTEKSLSSN